MATALARFNFIDLAHDVPGRIRFAIPALKGNTAKARTVCAKIGAARGVSAARVSLVTGSLVVEYGGTSQTRERIFAALHEAGYRLRPRLSSRALTNSSSSWGSIVSGTFAKTVARMIVEETLHAAVLAII